MNRREFIVGVSSMMAFPSLAKVDVAFNEELNDLIEFSKKCKIVDLKHDLVNFNPRPYQIDYFKNILNSNTLVCRKCRQCGATTMNLIYAHWMATRHPKKKIVMVFNNHAMADCVKFATKVWSKRMATASSIEYCTYGQFFETFTRNESVHAFDPLYSSRYLNPNTICIFDEYALASKETLTLFKMCDTIDSTKSIWVTTPTGDDSVCVPRLNGLSEITISWKDVPGWDEAWKNRQIQIIGEDRFNQEFEV